jgi:hypothetical protein
MGMVGSKPYLRLFFGAGLLAAAELGCAAAIDLALTRPAQAQFFDSRSPFAARPRPPRSGGFFGDLFGRPQERPVFEAEPPPRQSSDNSRAPSPRKADPSAVAPTTSVVVMGDAMADWLAYGLEDTFSDSPEVGIVRKNKLNSGLLRYDTKGDLDWWHVARDILNQEKPAFVVMMLGISDRESIRERDLAKEADKKESDKKESDKKPADPNKPAGDEAGQQIIAPEPPTAKRTNGTIDFRTEQWAAIYGRRIDDTIAALKSKGVPVFWVGLPSIKGTRSTADAVYLNDLFRSRAQRAGIIYIDVWDGFVDESGKYASYGPDYEGQERRLRSEDGVFFTKAGARKLAHYVEREIRRYMSNRGPLALPMGPAVPVPVDGKPAARPLAGPVVPLTVTPPNSDDLLGGANSAPAASESVAARVLVKGEPIAAPLGRADYFAWQGEPGAPPPVAASKDQPLPTESAFIEPPAAAKKPDAAKAGTGGKVTQNAPAKPKQRPSNELRPVPQREAPPRPAGRSSDPLGWFR